MLSSLTLHPSSHYEWATIIPTPFDIAHSLPSDQCDILFFLPFQLTAYFLKGFPLENSVSTYVQSVFLYCPHHTFLEDVAYICLHCFISVPWFLLAYGKKQGCVWCTGIGQLGREIEGDLWIFHQYFTLELNLQQEL